MQRPFPQSDIIALDIETTGLDFLHDSIRLITISDGEETLALAPPYSPDFGIWLHNEVFDRVVTVHNAMFDLPFLDHIFNCGYSTQVWDTMICWQMLNAGLGDKTSDARQERISLQTLAGLYLGVELDKSLQESFTDTESPLSEAQIEYAKKDAHVLPHIVKHQQKLIAGEHLETTWDIETHSIPVWCSMKAKGIYLDPDVLRPIITTAEATMRELGQYLQEELTYHVQDLRIAKFDAQSGKLQEWLLDLDSETQRLEIQWAHEIQGRNDGVDVYLSDNWEPSWSDVAKDLKDGSRKGQKRYVKYFLKQWREENPRPLKPKLVTDPINLGSSEQIKFALETYLGVEVKDTRANTLKRLIPDLESEEQRKLVSQLLEYRDAEKLVQSFGESLISTRDAEGFIHAEWNPYGTATGRPTCSSPNLLQIPKRKKISKQMRGAFQPQEGHVFIVCDYSQMELRLLAEMSRDSAFIEAFRTGVDVHAQGARDILSKEEISDTERTLAKTINLGIPYGMGVNKFILSASELGIHLSKEEANAFIEGWKKTHRQAWAFLITQQNKAVKQRWTQTPLGRKRWFEFEEGEYLGSIQRAGANHTIQGANADISKIAMACIHQCLKPFGGRVALQVYDEIVAEVPIEHAEIGAVIVKESMLEAARKVLKSVPAAVDCVISKSWSEADAILRGGE